MKHKLLNFSKNLIIALGLVVMVMILFFTTSSYAVTGHAVNTLGQLMRTTISDWYRWILRITLSAYVAGFLVIVLKLLADRTPERMATLKKSVGHFILMFAVIYFLHYIMLMIMALNDEGIKTAQAVGANFSGIDMSTDEYDLYETALSKAYEISAVPGFIGLLMYLLLVYYTYKFVIVYAKRYINIIILTLLAPIIFAMSTIKKILTGVSDGRIGKWFKEYIFNVVIQTLHAIFYAILIGLTLKMSDNDENLIGALLTLILFGFIFKIDAIIRKIFNFVGGSTKINSSKAVGTVINVTGGAVNAGLGALSGGFDAAGDKISSGLGNAQNAIESKGFGQAISDGFEKAKVKFKELPSEAADKMKELPGQAWDKTKEAGGKAFESVKEGVGNGLTSIGQSVSNAYAEAKAEVKDAKNILSGERVKENLTADEIVAAQHAIEEKQGLEGIRQGIQSVGLAVGSAIGSTIVPMGKFTKRKLNKAYNIMSGRVRYALMDTQREFQKDVRRLELENEVELVKKLPKIIYNYQKKHQLIKASYQGVALDTTTAMMLVIDINIDTKAFIEEIKKEYTTGNPILYTAFEKLGAQVLLSPTVGSARLGLGLLAEQRYEEAAEHRVEELATGRVREKRVIKAARRLTHMKLATMNDVAVRQERRSETGELEGQRTYTFSRFSAASAHTITTRMLNKTIQKDKYLAVISRTAASVEDVDFKAHRFERTAVEFTRTMQASSSRSVKSIRQIKLAQQAAITRQKELTRQTRRVEMANNVAGQVMAATNRIRLGFKQIDNMTPGEIGLQKMIQEGTARELSSGLIVMKQDANMEEKIRATGLVQQEEGTETPNTVIQFVMTEDGKIVPQVVTVEGQILQPAVQTVMNQMMQPQEDGKPLIVQIMESQAAGEPIVLQKLEGETDEQFALRQAITQAFTEYLQQQPDVANVQVLEGETKEQAIFRQFVTETINQYIVEKPEMGAQPVLQRLENETQEHFEMRQAVVQAFTQYMQQPEVQNVQVLEGETREQAILRQFVTETITQYVAENPEMGVQPVLERQENETQEHFEMRKAVVEAFTQYMQQPEAQNVQVLEGETREQAILRQFVTETVTQYVVEQPQVLVQPVLQRQENETQEHFEMRKAVVEAFTQYMQQPEVQNVQVLEGETREQAVLRQFVTETITQYVAEQPQTNIIQQIVQQPELANEQLVLERRENETDAQFAFRQTITQAFVQYVVEQSSTIETSPEQPVQTEVQLEVQQQFVQTIVQSFAGFIQPVEKATQEQVQTPEQTEMKQNIIEAFTQFVTETSREKSDVAKEMSKEEVQAQFIAQIVQTFMQVPQEEEKVAPITTSEEGVQRLEKIVQHVVTLDGTIIEQVVNEDNTISTEDYQVVEKADKSVMAQIQDFVATSNDIVTNKSLGLEETASVEDRVAKFQGLIDDVQRASSTDNLLQDILTAPAEQAEESSTEVAEAVVYAMNEAGITSKEELKQVMYFSEETAPEAAPGETPVEELARKQEIFESAISRNTVTTPSGPQFGGEDDDTMEDAMAHLTERVEELTEPDNDTLFNTAAEVERVRIAEELVNDGGFTAETPPTDVDIDEKVANLSDLLMDLAKETVKATVTEAAEEITEFPKAVLEETVDAMTEVIANAAEETKTPEEIAFDKEVAKAEKKWAKKHKTTSDSTMAEKLAKQDKSSDEEEESVVKITLKFYGGVRTQGQSVTLNNRHSIKDFYDKADKLESASMAKTVQRFEQTYGDKLKKMLMTPFDFSKNPVADMDGWSIYVVTEQEDVSKGEKIKEEQNITSETLQESLIELMDMYFSDIRRIFARFVEDHEIESFDEIYKNGEEKQELIRRLRMFFFRQGESNEQSKSVEIVENIYKDSRFRETLREINQERRAKGAVKDAKSRVKITDKKTAERKARPRITDNEVREFKERRKASLMDQVLDSVMTEQEEAAMTSPDVANLLNQLNETKVFIRTPGGDDGKEDRLRLQYQTDSEEEMP
ncbi:MAG: hypothetical protein IJ629_04230 [Clostridia bacterium]|nr:hypothetical protein [Clostridia bacterium]